MTLFSTLASVLLLMLTPSSTKDTEVESGHTHSQLQRPVIWEFPDNLKLSLRYSTPCTNPVLGENDDCNSFDCKHISEFFDKSYMDFLECTSTKEHQQNERKSNLFGECKNILIKSIHNYAPDFDDLWNNDNVYEISLHECPSLRDRIRKYSPKMLEEPHKFLVGCAELVKPIFRYENGDWEQKKSITLKSSSDKSCIR